MTKSPTVTHEEVHAYVDGQLSKSEIQKVEAWLAEHPEEAAAVHAYRLQNSKLHQEFDPFLDEKTPEKFVNIVSRRRKHSKVDSSPWLSLAASILMIAIGAVAGWFLHAWQTQSTVDPKGMFVSHAIGAHRIFTSERRHAVEVPSSQQAHLVRWLSKRIGTTLRTPDLTDLGFELVGGRLLADGTNPAAQFMYENSEGQRLTVYVRKATDIDDTSFRFSSENGNSAFYWIDREFAYALVAPIGKEKLLNIAQRVYDELGRN